MVKNRNGLLENNLYLSGTTEGFCRRDLYPTRANLGWDIGSVCMCVREGF